MKMIQKRNKNGETPYSINLEVSEKDIKDLRKGVKLWWAITDKRKLGYCEVNLEFSKKSEARVK
jgi:hypothetical protein